MKITQIRLSMLPQSSLPVCAYCTVSFDNQLAVHDLRIIRNGSRLFVAMPNRKRTKPCPKCHSPNSVAARFCANCGGAQSRRAEDSSHAARPHVDIAHPLTAEFRTEIEQAILAYYQQALQSAPCQPESGLCEGL